MTSINHFKFSRQFRKQKKLFKRYRKEALHAHALKDKTV